MTDWKPAVLACYPAAILTRDVDGFCWVRDGESLAALNDAHQPTKSPAKAWKSASERITQPPKELPE